MSARKYDSPAYAAVGYPAFGSLDGHTIDFFAPATGLIRALDVAAPEYQGGQDFIGAWDPHAERSSWPAIPAPVNDLQFLTGPVVGDVTGGGAGPAGDRRDLLAGPGGIRRPAARPRAPPGRS